MNILTFDTEEWYIEKVYNGNRPIRYSVYDDYLNRILDMLDSRNMKATFFCVGGLAKSFPNVIRRIAERGHEVGCHSNTHVWLNTLDKKQLYDDTYKAIASLEDVIGDKVLSYRAPAFSIGEVNKWAFEILAECGIERDASIYPSERDFGGFVGFGSKRPCLIKLGNHIIKEFPICLTRFFGKDFAFSGGGYFRLLPLWFIKKQMSERDYGMCYFHIVDLEYHPLKLMSRQSFEEYYKIPGSLRNRVIRMMKHNIGTKGAFDKMVHLINSYNFISIDEADKTIDWNNANIIHL